MMCTRWFGTRRIFSVLAAPLVIIGSLIGNPGAASASTCFNWTGVQPPSPGTVDNRLSGVAVLSSCNAWAVGAYFNDQNEDFGQTLIEHWNGSSWKQVPSPSPGGTAETNILFGVDAVSRANIWAVGRYSHSGADLTLIEHWNGTAWKQVPSPNVTSANILYSVTAVSAADVWAVGGYFNSADVEQTLIEHWNGTTWKRVPSPNPGGSSNGNFLFGVTAVSSANVWAVGGYVIGTAFVHKTLILHWNGTAWKQVPSPNPSSTDNILNGAGASSASNAWAVGEYFNSAGVIQTLTEHWNGTAWKQVPSPNPGGSHTNLLNGVTATSAANAWAVGYYFNGTANRTLIEHWNGTAWKQVASPNPSSSDNILYGVGASSASNLWAVGSSFNGTIGQALALHCC